MGIIDNGKFIARVFQPTGIVSHTSNADKCSKLDNGNRDVVNWTEIERGRPTLMAQTRRERLQAAITTAMEYHPDAAIRERRSARVPRLIEAWQAELHHTECPRCNQRDCALSAQPVSYRAGLRDRTEKICALCLKEVQALRGGYAPVYTVQ